MDCTAKHALAAFAAALLLLLSPPAPAATRTLTIVAFGDSTTAPRGALEVYPRLLQNELVFRGGDLRVVNAGIGGNTTRQAKARMQKDVLDLNPDVVVIQFGLNDSAVDVWKTPPATEPRVSLAEYEANLRGFVRTLKQRGARPVLMTPNPLRWTPQLVKLYGRGPYRPEDADGLNVLLRDYVEAVRRVAREEGAGLIDVYVAVLEEEKKLAHAQGEPSGLLLDGMHPNDRGQRLVAELLMAHLTAQDSRLSRKTPTKP